MSLPSVSWGDASMLCVYEKNSRRLNLARFHCFAWSTPIPLLWISWLFLLIVRYFRYLICIFRFFYSGLPAAWIPTRDGIFMHKLCIIPTLNYFNLHKSRFCGVFEALWLLLCHIFFVSRQDRSGKIRILWRGWYTFSYSVIWRWILHVRRGSFYCRRLSLKYSDRERSIDLVDLLPTKINTSNSYTNASFLWASCLVRYTSRDLARHDAQPMQMPSVSA
jgi:hypothetical protein